VIGDTVGEYGGGGAVRIGVRGGDKKRAAATYYCSCEGT